MSPDLPAEVRAACTELPLLLDVAERPAPVEAPELPTVVVVGETGRGKSSLVNALLHAPGLSPVDAAAATPVHVVLTHGAQPGVTVHWADDRPPLAVAPFDSWRVLLDALGPDAPPPRWVQVSAPIPLLAHLDLVDTPGVGGLDGLHAGLAAAAAARATALLVVLDAGAPLTHPELDLLRALGAGTDTVLLALTKIDVHRDWRHVLEVDRALLAEHVPRLAGARVLPVSSRLAAQADTAPTAELARLLREQSGIAQLQAELQRTVAHRAAMLSQANALRGLHSALVGAAAEVAGTARALQSPDVTAATLRDRRTELVEQRRSGARAATLLLRAEVQRTRVESTHDVARGVRDTQARFRAAVDAADRDTLAGLPAQLDPALGALAVAVGDALARRLARVAPAVLGQVLGPDELAVHPTPVPLRTEVVSRPVEARVRGSEDRLLVVAGASGGVGLGKLALAPLALVPGLNLVLVPLTLGLGASAAWWMARARGHLADRVHVKQWAAEVLAEARAALDQLVAEQLIDAEHALGVALDEALGRRVGQIDAELRAVDAALRLGSGERAQRAGVADSRHAELVAGARRAELLLARVAQVRDRR